jgi:large conductance mechanosensitive channel
MSFASEFKEFAMKGNVIDLAVGVVIGAAFGKIVSSLVGDVIMPALAPILGSVKFNDLAVQIATDAAGKPVLLKYGVFLQTIFEFLVIAFSIFLVIKGINQLKRPAPPPPDAPPPPPTRSEQLLTEIRDLLTKK